MWPCSWDSPTNRSPMATNQVSGQASQFRGWVFCWSPLGQTVRPDNACSHLWHGLGRRLVATTACPGYLHSSGEAQGECGIGGGGDNLVHSESHLGRLSDQRFHRGSCRRRPLSSCQKLEFPQQNGLADLRAEDQLPSGAHSGEHSANSHGHSTGSLPRHWPQRKWY